MRPADIGIEEQAGEPGEQCGVMGGNGPRQETGGLLADGVGEDVRLFRERGPAGGSLTLLVVFGGQAGIAVVLFPFFQAVLGWSGLLSTVAMMPMAVMMVSTSGPAPRMAARTGARSTMSVGITLSALGLALMALFVSVDGGYLSVLPGMLAMGIGMGLVMARPPRPSPAPCPAPGKAWPPP